MTEYCCSAPQLYIDKKGDGPAVTGWVVFIAPKEGSYPRKYGNYDCGDTEYTNLVELLNKEFDESKPGTDPYFFLDIDDYVFQPLSPRLAIEGSESISAIRQSSRDLSSKLMKLGMTYNQALDPLLRDWISKKIEANSKESKAPAAKGRKPKASQQINLRPPGS